VRLGSKDKPEVAAKTVLTIDLSQQFSERMQNNPLAALSSDASNVPGLFDVVRLIGHAKTNDNIKGILLMPMATAMALRPAKKSVMPCLILEAVTSL
jgi:hypothetical protein